MIDRQLDELMRCSLERPLDGLERDVWAQIDVETNRRRLSGLVIKAQVILVAILLAGGLAFSGAGPRTQPVTARLDVFSVGAALAPSTLLLGHHS